MGWWDCRGALDPGVWWDRGKRSEVNELAFFCWTATLVLLSFAQSRWMLFTRQTVVKPGRHVLS